MLKEQMSKFKEIFKTDDGNNKKKIENLIVFVIILIITIIVINTILNDGKKSSDLENSISPKTLAKSESDRIQDISNEDELKRNLEDILSKIEGVGKTNVLITYSQTSQLMPLYNEDSTISDTEEKDSRRRK